MTLYKRILLGILFISFCLVGLIFINAQLILVDSYQQLEEQNATQNVERVLHVLQSDLDSIRLSDINWFANPSLRSASVISGRAFVPDNSLNPLNLDTKLSISLLVDHQNHILFQNAVNISDGKTATVSKAMLDSIKAGSPLLDNHENRTLTKGIMALPEGLLMTISVPVYAPSGHDTNWGRLIGGRFIDDEEIEHLADSTKLDVKIVAYNSDDIPGDFLRAKNKLDSVNHFYVEPVNNQLISSYTTVDDIYGEPAMMIRAQMPRSIYQYGQSSINSFFVSMVIIIVLLGAVVYLLFERTVLARLTGLVMGMNQAKASDSLVLEVLSTGNDEIFSLTNGIKELLKTQAQTRAQLQEVNDALERRVTERTAELTNANTRLEQELNERKQANVVLTQARDKALGELQLKSQLLANVSHDARTPLTIIGLNTEMLQQKRHGELNDKQTEVLDRILNASHQLLNFITNMLDEAQLKNGKMSIINITFEPKRLIEDLVRMLEPLAESKGIIIKADIDLGLPAQLIGDPNRLKQVLTNLSENAIKFTDQGSILIKAQRDDSLQWSIRVIDTGCGIPPEAQTRIFEAYWQLQSTLKRGSNRGVGLGLSIVKQIVQLMKGSITVTSKVGEGTTFIVTLPIEEAKVVEPVIRLTF